MALSKLTNLDNGTSGSYWKIVQVSIDKKSMSVICRLELFLDKEHADLGKNLGMNKVFRFNISKEDLNSNIVALGYERILALNPPDSDLDGAESI